PINNIVDITNYVMEEYGQPMHAYDLDTIEGKKIIVDRAKDGDTFVTLDGQERKLDAGVLMINDGAKAVGIAGIMGGENSKITDDVKTMLFEAACFDGTNIRLSGRRIGLRSDAAGKFEKGLDPNTTMEAMNRACQLIEELGAGEVVGGCVDVYPNPKKPWVVPFSLEKCNKLLGTNVGMDEVREYFKRLELDLNEAGDAVTVPTWRQDILRNADLAEEIARFFGYDKIPTTLPSGEATMGGYPFEKRVENVALDAAVAHSYCESMTYSFESPKVFDKLLYAKDAPERVAIKISNPLGEDFSVMRTVPVNGMLTSLATNYNRRNKDVKLFEMAKVYLSDSEKPVELPDERVKMVLGCIGEGDFFTMKGTLEEILIAEGMKGLVTYENKGNIPFLHPGRQAVISYGNKEIGYLGEVHPDVTDTYGIGEKAYLGVLDMKLICEFANFDYKYEGIAKFPAMSRDISMVMKKEITAGQIEEIIRKRGGKLLESYNLFDIYEGVQIRPGYKSMAYTVTFRDKEKTLEDKTVNEIMDKILKSLEEIGVELRK
ncbi:MAG: phenylalanine--tRNA ligase subunit beta, partial [Lachnospiraceae bacterium]|nr:phenylalanine--tRNA ligase subunit beta [Lachnospiraceae bacterium]